jgi:multidrug resistance protein MdtO
MATLATSPVAAQSRSGWLWQFLRDELEPYPERVQLAGRMVLTATLVMLVCMAYRVPYAFEGPVLALFVSRESTRATINSVFSMALGLVGGTIFVIASAPLFTTDPILHFIWVGFALFVVFFALPTVNSYIGVLMFSVMITVGLPLWDRAVPAKVNVEDTLWLLWVCILGVGVALLVELAFARMAPGDNIIQPVCRRLDAVEAVLRCFAEGRPLDSNALRDIQRVAMLGTSLAHRNAQRSGMNLRYVARAGGVISLVGTLVDTTASLTELAVRPSDDERRRARELADSVSQLGIEFLARQTPAPIHFRDLGKDAPGLPLLRELEETVELIPQVFAEPPAMHDEPQPGAPAAAPLFAHDAFTNNYYLQFGVKGTLAAMLCYVFYTTVNWPGIGTSVVTCAFTALTTIGASRQKQFLRFLGAAVGGFVFGMGAQIFILPYVDTIFGFTVLFIVVTAISAWFMTASPRLSYFGVQIALAFYLVHLQSFKFETSLSIARDRVVGVLVGLFAMWLIFDQLWGHPAAADMRKTFIANLRLLAQLAREPDLGDRKDALRRIYALGQTINGNFDRVKSLGDGVLFEFGPSRSGDLALRARITQWQSKLRALFLVRGAMLRYRLAVRGFELPPEMEPAQKEFDHELSETLDGMAETLEGNPAPRAAHLDQALARVESDAAAHPAPHLNDFLALCRTETQLALSVSRKRHL